MKLRVCEVLVRPQTKTVLATNSLVGTYVAPSPNLAEHCHG